MTYIQSIALGFKAYTQFKGRSSPSEAWPWGVMLIALFGVFCLIYLLFALAGVQGGPVLGVTVLVEYGVFIALFCPTLALLVRRLHDTGRSGQWAWLALTILGNGLLIYWMLQPGDTASNDFDQDRVNSHLS